MKKWLLPCLALILTACSSSNVEKLIDPEREKVARNYIQRLIDGDIAGLTNELEPALRKPDTARIFAEMRALLPPGAPLTVDLLGFGANRRPKELTCSLNYQYGYRDQWFLVTVSWREKIGVPREITELRVIKMERPLQEANAFTFARARPRHYAFALAVVVIPLFILVSLVACLRTNGLPLKWVWSILILVGLVRFSLNWTTGLLVVVPFSIQLFGASVMAAGKFAPWVISVSLPLGAVTFWIRRRHLRRTQPRTGFPSSH